jgi:ATPase involved in DNA repair
MIEDVRLRDFISHGQSMLELKDGVNIFVGRNGAGKSSVVDAITYALFGEHTRGASANLVRRGSQEGMVEVIFTIGGRRYLAARRIRADGKLIECALKELTETGEKILLVAGERKQYGESMTEKVASVIGLDYEKMKVATIIQQGELDSIVTEYSPRKLKEMINDMIGIGSLHMAFDNARDVTDQFRAKLRSECLNYDDTTLEDLEEKLSQDEQEKEGSENELAQVSKKLGELETKEVELSGKLEALEKVKEKIIKIQEKKHGLYEHVKQVRGRLLQELKEVQDKILGAPSRLKVVAEKENLEKELGEIGRKEEELNEKMNKLSSQLGELKAVDLQGLKKELADVERNLSKVESKISKLEDEIKKLESIEKPGEREELESKREQLEERKTKLENEIGGIRGKLQDYKEIEETGVCPTCDSEIEPKDIKLKIAKKEQEEKSKKEEEKGVKKELEKLQELLRELEEYEEAQEKLKEKRENKEEAEEELSDLRKKKEDVRAKLDAAEKNASLLPSIEKEYAETRSELQKLKERKKELEKKRKEVGEAEAWLKQNGIAGPEDVNTLQAKVEELEGKIRTIPEEPVMVELELLKLDEYSSKLVAEITRLEEETRGFREEDYKKTKEELELKLRPEKEKLLGDKGRLEGEVEKLRREVEELTEAKNKIDVAARYIKLFEKIRANVYKRDGNVATSLRSWALKEIGRAASDYIRLFSIGISSIQIEEKAKDVEMACYGGSGKRDVDSMSGGEKVAVALALRFALANLMGKGRTDFIILDEPTIYLDSDRRKSLVELISRLNRAQEERLTPLNQIIIITHDEDVFEGSEVNAVFKFEETSGGSRVICS